MTPIITVDKLSKKYQLGYYKPYETLRDTIMDLFKKPQNDNKILKAKEFWALKDVSFEVNPGEVVGIIGRNGAGKSTLLKILSRITLPTSGTATLNGRVASLLEVGTGFSAELTGRENIFLNGTVLGMTRKEIKRKFDTIVEFSEIGTFIDTPVKYYSSGMYMRLAFAVAAHLEPEILIVDEVLSVGDLSFQKKSLGKIESLTKSEGRTVLFVSHNLGAVNELCDRTVLLDKGQVVYIGETEKAIRLYSQQNSEKQFKGAFQGDLTADLALEKVRINGKSTANQIHLPADELHFELSWNAKRKLTHLVINFSLYKDGIRLFTISDAASPLDQRKGKFVSKFTLPPYLLRPGYYSLAMGGYRLGSGEWMWGTDILGFDIAEVWSKQNSQHNLGVINISTLGERHNER